MGGTLFEHPLAYPGIGVYLFARWRHIVRLQEDCLEEDQLTHGSLSTRSHLLTGRKRAGSASFSYVEKGGVGCTMEIRYESELPTAEEIYELYEHLQWNIYLGLSQEKLLKAIQQSYCAIYAYHEDQLIGTGRIISDGIINAYLCGLGVHPDYRDRGIGTAISRLLMEQCSNHNLHLQFFCEEGLIPYYERLGFTVFAVGMKPAEKR